MPRRRSRQTIRIINWLMEQERPATAGEIAAATHVHISAVNAALRRNREVFVPSQVETINSQRRAPRLVWAAWEE